MNPPITLSIKLFGAFRKYHAGTLNVDVAAGSSAQAVKAAIAAALRQAKRQRSQDRREIQRVRYAAGGLGAL